ncbi:UDP-N-acetylglucosamine 4,6-dehydratase (inverting) [Hwanghaeella grinnelliae]|uniref:UDP-N-acetylglucosamine 4,6-dehydratase (Inverting) n=1 Tax=Hwanghaeella grinnelliae TaxID=2500179 RepID=A0A437QR45_9PROT|nr:UDP-N-acetylglucosamine 4,6-dehydratase (inverting) [Hwanghaeella grinnelliae]RVU36980.1 UDP-N-acetylglucosamine 4,6-dehydratase (inverting) [Hwanghaeella grinnelliae]
MRSFTNPEMDLNGKNILVTGGTGSFGHAFVKSVIERYTPERLIIFSRDELKQYEMAQVFSDTEHPFLRYFIGDVRDLERLKMAMRGVDYVVHAAALKHVPIAEYNPFECIRTNVHGAENVVNASIYCGVKKVVALSTDKAANPINLYGASKLASDKIFVAGNALGGRNGPRFSVVRYGNVMGSRGSVVPLFKRLVNNGATHLPITHPDMTRFWITLRQGVNMVLSSFARMQGGEIFVPKIPSVDIKTLCAAIAPDLPMEDIGIRPGEKMHEIMITEDDARATLELDDIYVIMPLMQLWRESSREEYFASGAREVDPRFSFASDTNTEWLSLEETRTLLNSLGY